MSSSVERVGGVAEDPVFLQAFLHDDSAVYHVPQHNRRQKLRFPPEDLLTAAAAPSLPFVRHVSGSLHDFPPYSSALFARIPDYSTLSNQNQQKQNSSLTLLPPPLRTSAVTIPLGPFTGYSSTLSRSRFLYAARQLLEEMTDLSGVVTVAGEGGAREALSIDSELVSGCVRGPTADAGVDEQQLTRARLISMINEVCTRYMFYFQQVQAVVQSFEMVVGVGNAAPWISSALKSMSKHFKCVKNIITGQLERINKASLVKESFNVSGTPVFGFRSEGHGHAGGNLLSSSAHSHLWRPQRGLPERAVAVLRSWLFEHFLHPYPSDLDKQMLAKQTGLTRNQVSNWFINARVRVWKPMVEEIHNMELRQVRGAVAAAAAATSELLDMQASQPSSSTATSSTKQTPTNGCILAEQTSCSEPPSSELSYVPHPNEETYELVYHDFPGHGVNAVGFGAGGSSTGVSLTLGLPWSTEVRMPERLPLNFARRFGLEECGDAYAFEEQDGHFLHRFVG